MKKFIILVFMLVCLNSYAYQEAYRVVGMDDDDRPVHGTIYTNDEPLEVEGQLTDSDGNTHDFYGRWNGEGQVTGQTAAGEMIDLKTY